jgi:Na+-transporting methylmalonyl-CoA/oxaloacetate decarboxylase gamma subunit
VAAVIKDNNREGTNMFALALRLMLYGLTGVFAALAVIYAALRIMVKVFPYKAEDEL